MNDTCKYCGTVATPNDEPNCASLDEAYQRTISRPYGCPWFTAEDRKRHARPVAEAPKDGSICRFNVTLELNAFWCDDLKRWVLSSPLTMEYLPTQASHISSTLRQGERS